MIQLRRGMQTVAAINRVLGRFLAGPANAAISLERSVVVFDEARVRVVS